MIREKSEWSRPALLFRLGWLKQLGYARDLCSSQWLYLELLAQERQAVAAGFGIQCMRRVVEIEAFRLAYDRCVFSRPLWRQILLLRSVLHEYHRRRCVRYELARIKPGILGYKSVEAFRTDLLSVLFVFLRFNVHFI